jgi:peptidoglycan/xylan/chitin deacetylase (PgdA/CDA1 family)
LLNAHARLTKRRVGLALCYHAVAPAGGDPAHELLAPLSVAEFERQLRLLRRRYRLVTASELPGAVRDRRRGARVPLAMTFDDDLPEHVAHAAPVLRRAGAPATFFVSGAGLDGGDAFWWQSLQAAWDAGRVGRTERARWGGGTTIRDVARTVQAMAPADRAAAAVELRTLAAPHPHGGRTGTTRHLGAEELAELARDFELGFHTRAHDDLRTLTADALPAALADGRAALEQAVGRSVSVLSYPHGGAGSREAAAAGAAGYNAAFVADGRPVRAGDDVHLLGRRYPARRPAGRFALDLARAIHGA